MTTTKKARLGFLGAGWWATANYLPLLAILVCTLIWASTFVVVKDALDDFSPLLYLALRMGVATVFFVALRGTYVTESRSRGALLSSRGGNGLSSGRP